MLWLVHTGFGFCHTCIFALEALNRINRCLQSWLSHCTVCLPRALGSHHKHCSLHCDIGSSLYTRLKPQTAAAITTTSSSSHHGHCSLHCHIGSSLPGSIPRQLLLLPLPVVHHITDTAASLSHWKFTIYQARAPDSCCYYMYHY